MNMNAKRNSGIARALLTALTTALVLAACGGGGGGSTAGSGSSTGSGSVGSGGSTTGGTLPTTAAPTIYQQAAMPAKLSSWNAVGSDGTTMAHNAAMVTYDLNSALFSDYALKMRAIYVPTGQKINYNTTSTLDFPIGTAIVKTFYYPKATGTDAKYTAVGLQTTPSLQGTTISVSNYRLIETRVLVRQTDGSWGGATYVWDADQKDATLTTGGAYFDLELVPASGATQKFTYAVPNLQSCQQCHASATNGAGSMLPIGPKARNLNKNYAYSGTVTKNQLQQLSDLNLMNSFTSVTGLPTYANWTDTSQTLEARAKAYLDVNCAHCHVVGGYAGQSGLLLTHDNIGNLATPDTWGVCKKPLATTALDANGPLANMTYDINPKLPANSFLLYRMATTMTGQKMPVVGRGVNHTEAIALVRDWITSLPQASCDKL
jgi:uncharacterized repeat protein (TIGR03806 family)